MPRQLYTDMPPKPEFQFLPPSPTARGATDTTQTESQRGAARRERHDKLDRSGWSPRYIRMDKGLLEDYESTSLYNSPDYNSDGKRRAQRQEWYHYRAVKEPKGLCNIRIRWMWLYFTGEVAPGFPDGAHSDAPW